jgi:HEAT repeat protein
MADRLAQHLVQRGLLPAERVEEGLRRQALSGGTLDTALLEAGAVSEAGILQAVADVTGQRLVNLADFEANHDVASYIPPKIAERLGVVPLSVEGNALHVASCYPLPSKELEEISFLLNKRLELWVALEVRIRDWVSTIYHLPLPPRYAALLAALDPSRPLPAPATPRPTGSAPRELMTLEDELSQQMVDQLAESVAREPIPLQVRKARPPPEEAPLVDLHNAPTVRTSAFVMQPPVGFESLGAGIASASISASPPAAGGGVASASTWEPVETALIDIQGYQAFARESARSPEPAPRAKTPLAFQPPPVAPLQPNRDVPPPRQASAVTDRMPTQPEFPAPVATRPPARAEARTDAPGPSPVADVVPHWTLAQAREALKQAMRERDQILDVAMSYARQTFDFVAAFAVIRGSAVGWDARGDGTDRSKVEQISIPLDTQSVFRTVALTRGSYVGPLPPDALTKHFLGLLGRAPRSALVFPVEVKARLVAILYGDSGQKPVSQRRLSDLILFCQDLPAAFQELILFKKHRFEGGTGDASSDEDTLPPVPTSHWSPQTPMALPGLGRAAAFSAPISPQDERPPPDFDAVLRRLTGPDAAARSRAMAELARAPEASARVLVRTFPGPTAWSRLPVVELPEAEELGPIPGALARLGRPAAQALVPLLDSDDADTRYFALLTAGNVPYGELVDGVLRGLFDLEPDISSAARAAATALRRLPRFDGQMRALRQELAAVDSLRRTLAARALGTLHDRESIDGLIGLTGSQDQMCAQAAAEALREITKASLGTQPRAWSAWWAENRARPRAHWLVAALRARDFDVRLSAIEELSKALNNNLGYFADAPSMERETALKRWEQTLAANNERLRRLDQ